MIRSGRSIARTQKKLIAIALPCVIVAAVFTFIFIYSTIDRHGPMERGEQPREQTQSQIEELIRVHSEVCDSLLKDYVRIVLEEASAQAEHDRLYHSIGYDNPLAPQFVLAQAVLARRQVELKTVKSELDDAQKLLKLWQDARLQFLYGSAAPTRPRQDLDGDAAE